jgi:DNA-binding transcriptional LysR family regulator
MELRRLHYFAEIVHAGSFRRAARQLGLTQPGLTTQIQRLEQDLGVQLFDRSRKPARPTPAGEAILTRVQALFVYFDRFEQDVANIVVQHRTARLALGVAYQTPAQLLSVLARFGELHPEIDVTLKEELRADLLRAMTKGEFDACFVSLTDNAAALPSRYRSVQLLSADWLFIAPADHRLANRGEVSLQELADERFVLSDGASGAAVKKAFRETGTPLHVAWQTTGANLIPSLVAQGLGIGFVPPDLTVGQAHAGLRAFRVKEVHFAYRFVLIWLHEKSGSSALRSLLAFIDAWDWTSRSVA